MAERVTRTPRPKVTNTAGRALRWRCRTILDAVSQQVIARAKACKVVQPEYSLAKANGGQDISHFIWCMPEQAVDREAAPGRSGGCHLAQRVDNRLWPERPDRFAVPHETERLSLGGLPHQGPGPRAVQMKVIAPCGGHLRRLTPNGQLQPAQIGREVVVTEGQVKTPQAILRRLQGFCQVGT